MKISLTRDEVMKILAAKFGVEVKYMEKNYNDYAVWPVDEDVEITWEGSEAK